MTDTTAVTITEKPKKPAKAKAAPKAKAKKAATKGKAKPSKKPEADTKTAACIALAQRAKGVTIKELKELTGWEAAPWRWTFTNPKKTGWADRLGLKFRTEVIDGTLRYFLSK